MNINLKKYIDHVKVNRNSEGELCIFDPIRKSFYLFQPEELVRQLLMYYLIHVKSVPKGLIQVEKQILVNGIRKRFDVVIYDRQVKPYVLIECKAPEVNITQAVIDQIAIYNYALDAPFLLVTNGADTRLFRQDHASRKMLPVDDFSMVE